MNRQNVNIALLLLAALAALAISAYQWIALYEMRIAGTEPVCSVSETVNCASVWNSPLSNTVHAATGVPFPGWGVAFALTIAVLGAALLLGRPAGLARAAPLALRLVGSGATLVTLILLGYSMMIGVYCPTCIGFYLGVWLVTFAAWRIAPSGPADWLLAGLHGAAVVAVAILAVIVPGLKTPATNLAAAALPGAEPAAGTPTPSAATGPLTEFLGNASPELKQALSDTLNQYRGAPAHAQTNEPGRMTFGAASAPVRLIEWIDIGCPHCRNLHTALDQIKKLAPAGTWSLESRNYPLDAQCNPNITRSDGTGIRCLAAKILICLAGTDQEAQVRSSYFANQERLTAALLWNLAAPDAAQRATLESCTQSPATASALAADIALAETYQIHGTPLTVVNGRVAPALPATLYALILAGGDDNHRAFAGLPAPRPVPAE